MEALIVREDGFDMHSESGPFLVAKDEPERAGQEVTPIQRDDAIIGPWTPPRLVLVEGLIGSGKTTAARRIALALAAQGAPVTLYAEGDPLHPADFESCAWLDDRAWDDVRRAFPEGRDVLDHWAVPADGGRLVLYGQAGEAMPRSLAAELARFDVYDGTAADRHQRLVASRWADFAAAEAQRTEPRTVVFECCFLQNAVSKLVLQHDLGEETVARHLQAIAGSILPLQPLVVYLRTPDVRTTLDQASRERSPQWLSSVIRYYTTQGYGRGHGLFGYEGLVRALERRQEMELRLLNRLPIRSVALDPDAGTDRWKGIEQVCSAPQRLGGPGHWEVGRDA